MTAQALNLSTYERPNIVGEYAAMTRIFGAERALIDLLGPRLKTMAMLDIGVGGGRTTTHFAHLAKSYVGTDYAQGMVQACETRFGERWPFVCCDARDMRLFPDASFDFLFFSFAGLDMLAHSDRLAVFREIRRLAKPGAVFAFSSHNLRRADAGLVFKQNTGESVAKAVLRYVAKRVLNVSYYLGRPRDHAQIIDGVHQFGLKIYYIDPEVQAAQLAEAGFKNIQIFRQDDGAAMRPETCDCLQPTYVCEIA